MCHFRLLWRRELRRIVPMIGGLLSASVITSEPVWATAVYDADILASVTITTPALENVFGFATFPGIVGDPFTAHSLPASMAAAAGGAAVIPAGIRSFSHVDGIAQPPDAPLAFAISFIDTLQKINLANLTGSGPPTPAPEIIKVAARLVVDYGILVAEIAPNGNASAAVHVDLMLGAALLFDFTLELTAPPNAAANGSFTINFDGNDRPLLSLPPNSITPLTLRTYAIGSAQMTMPPDIPPPPPPNIPPRRIPEPGTAGLLLLALLGGAGIRSSSAARARVGAAPPP